MMIVILLMCYDACKTSAFGKFYILDGYLFKESRLCVLLRFMRELLVRVTYQKKELLVREAHGGGLIYGAISSPIHRI
jgi:hypothetical protein